MGGMWILIGRGMWRLRVLFARGEIVPVVQGKGKGKGVFDFSSQLSAVSCQLSAGGWQR